MILLIMRKMGEFQVTVIFFVCVLFLGFNANASKKESLKLWYDEPAEQFINALVLGNGRLGAVVYGRPELETINLNEETFWSGGPVERNPNPTAPQFIEPIRKALDENNYALAEQLSLKTQGYFSQSYTPIGDLIIKQHFEGKVENYYRDLNIENAISTSRFSVGKTYYTRESFVSAPDQVIVLHFSSSTKAALNFSITTQTQVKGKISVEQEELILNGRAPSHADPVYINIFDPPIQWESDCKGMRMQMRVKALHNDGILKTTHNELMVSGATNVTLIVSIATSFNGFDQCPVSEGRDEGALAKAYLTKIGKQTYSMIKASHIADYKSYFDKLKFEIETLKKVTHLTTDERLESYKKDATDYGLEALLFQYGRYLLISSSRPGGIAANLQGIWNLDLRPPWSANYTVNINLEMNYWLAEKTGLGAMHEPMLQQVLNMSQTGKDIAKNMYGMPGWAMGHNSDIWAHTSPVGHLGLGQPRWATWLMGAPWVTQHLWEKYAFRGDKEYLKTTAYPVMKSAAEFCLAWLISDGKGHLITSPSTSPENTFIGEDGISWSVAKGVTLDLALIRNLFKNTIEASEILKIDADFSHILQNALGNMLPYKIGKAGNLQEWMTDYKDQDPHHRHISHLFCLHPGNDISANKTPELFNACKQTLLMRGDGGTGWAISWKVAFWARLLDGNHAHKLLQNTLHLHDEKYSRIGGSYPNLLNACPPYQIDGNFGVVEGICEMLLQSHLNEIHLLPSLPNAWSKGSISGLLARGGYTLRNMVWENAQLKEAIIESKNAGTCKLRTQQPIIIKGVAFKTVKDTSTAGITYLHTFEVKAGGTYIVRKI